ncbi:MAG: hypothetical protein ACI30L_08665 [Muribaculaceae bacterium]
MLFSPYADPEIGLIGFAALFLSGFVIGLFDYDKKKKKKEEEERRQAEKEETDRLMREYLEKKLKEEETNNKYYGLVEFVQYYSPFLEVGIS